MTPIVFVHQSGEMRIFLNNRVFCFHEGQMWNKEYVSPHILIQFHRNDPLWEEF